MTSKLAAVFIMSLAVSGGALAQYSKPQSTSASADKGHVNSPQSTRKADGKSDATKPRNPDRSDFLGAPAVVVVPEKR